MNSGKETYAKEKEMKTGHKLPNFVGKHVGDAVVELLTAERNVLVIRAYSDTIELHHIIDQSEISSGDKYRKVWLLVSMDPRDAEAE